MKKIVFILLFLSAFFSCDKTSEVMRIIVRNDTGECIAIKLFPKSEYLSESGSSYHKASNGGGYQSLKFELENDNVKNWLYTCGEINSSPTELVAKIFDSIYVVIPLLDDSLFIRFTPSIVSGYTENLFTNILAWGYDLNNYDYPMQISAIHEKAHEYYFVVSEDKFEFGK